MKLEKLPARKAKAKIFYWLRLDQRCAFIATECGGWSADVLGVNEKKLIEVEIKVSKSDLLGDHRKHKHAYYNKKMSAYGFSEYEHRWYPTHFYYAVPEKLVETCREFLEKNGFVNYGIIDVDAMKVIKRAGWLHKNEPSNHVKYSIGLRMCSELLRFHEAWI